MVTKVRRPLSQKHFNEVVRLLDEGESYREISETLHITSQAINSISTAANAGFSSVREYNNDRVRKNGYKSMAHYVKVMRVLASESSGSSPKQHQFEEKMEREGLVPERSHSVDINGADVTEAKESTYDYALEKLEPYLARLTPSQKERFVSYYLDNMSTYAIARRESTSPFAISSSIRKAKRTLIRMLSPSTFNAGKTIEDFAD